MRRLYLVLIATAFLCTAKAQKEESKEYIKMKEELTEKIFGSADPFFKTTEIPEKYKNESVVILAQKHSIESDSKYKIKLGLFAASGVKYNFFDIFRRKLMINDQSALEEYSQLNFTKLQTKGRGILGKERNYTFINIRVIKPNGTVKTVNVDESAVVLKDEKNEKQNKIAIPDLNIGDIIDYYVASYYQEGTVAGGGSTPLLYILGDEYPVLNYVISLQFDSRISAEYQCINGAPDFKIASDADGGGNVMSMAVKDIPKIKGLIWSVAARQLPIIRINYQLGNMSRRNMPDIKQGNVAKATRSYADMAEEDMAFYTNASSEYAARTTRGYKSERSDFKDAWKDYVKKYPKADNPDSTASIIYRLMLRDDYFRHFQLNTNFNNAYFNTMTLQGQIDRIVLFAYIMKFEFKTEIDLLVTTSKEEYSRDNVFTVRDLSVMARVNEPKPKFFKFGDDFEIANVVPYEHQGEKAKVFPFDSRSFMGLKIMSVSSKESSTITLPVSSYKENTKKDIVKASLDPSDMQLMIIHRKASSTGQFKKDDKAALTIYEEIFSEINTSVGLTGNILESNKDRAKSDRLNENDLSQVLEKARVKHKEDFENEIERNYGTKAKELKQFKILNFGMTANTSFEFEEDFTIEGWVKKAGNNYIVDIGKLITSQITIEKDQRERTKDIYMPFAREFSYQVEFIIPEGYTADGLDKLDMKLENETGAFVSTAQQEGNKIVLNINKYYSKTFYSSDKWPLLLAFLDKAMDYNQQKLLLKKK